MIENNGVVCEKTLTKTTTRTGSKDPLGGKFDVSMLLFFNFTCRPFVLSAGPLTMMLNYLKIS